MNQSQNDSETVPVSAIAGELRVLLGRLRRRLREESHMGDLTPSQTSVLSQLERTGPATVTTLARGEGVRPQSIGATVAVLEAAGLVSGTPDPADGRQTLLSLTDACREMIHASRAAKEDWLAHAIEEKLTTEEQEQLAVGIGLLQRLVES